MMNSCCSKPEKPVMSSCCGEPKTTAEFKIDWLIAVCTPLIVIPYLLSFFPADGWLAAPPLQTFIHSVHHFIHATWWGVLIGIIFLALLSRIPREFVMSALGKKTGPGGILRAIGAGVALDMCSHGILMVGTKLYERGASLGQVMAFLIASPWNSISLTFILFGLIGVKLTLLFIVLSIVVAFVSGLIFDTLAGRGVLVQNPNRFDVPEDFAFWTEAKKQLKNAPWTTTAIGHMFKDGLKDSRIVLRWLMLGIVLASVLRVFMDPEMFSAFFGPTLVGMMATVAFATVLEVCSEGSSPIAADLVNRAGAPGNAFTFLMAGVSTDYTEIMVLKDTTKSWKTALFLPLVTLPQVILLGIFLNIALL